MRRKLLKNFSLKELVAIAMADGDNSKDAIYTISKLSHSHKIKSLFEILQSGENIRTVDMVISLLSKIDLSSDDGKILKTELPKLIIENEKNFVVLPALKFLEKIYKKVGSNAKDSIASDFFSIHKAAKDAEARYLAFMFYINMGHFTRNVYENILPIKE